MFCLLRDGVLRAGFGWQVWSIGQKFEGWSICLLGKHPPCPKPPIRVGGQEGGVGTSDIITPLSPYKPWEHVAAQCWLLGLAREPDNSHCGFGELGTPWKAWADITRTAQPVLWVPVVSSSFSLASPSTPSQQSSESGLWTLIREYCGQYSPFLFCPLPPAFFARTSYFTCGKQDKLLT